MSDSPNLTTSHDDLIRELIAAHPELAADFEVAARKRALGRALWRHFETAKISKAELARRMNTSVPAINRLFSAASHGACTATTLFKFEIATGVRLFVHDACQDCSEVSRAYHTGFRCGWDTASIRLQPTQFRTGLTSRRLERVQAPDYSEALLTAA